MACGGSVSGLTDAHACFNSYDAGSTDEVTCWRQCLDDVAVGTLEALAAHELNLVTAESLTSGMIASTLVDITPGYGSYVYGGHSVYDSDAKRQFIGVRVGDVYTETCARQMAAGALESGRALVAVAVTGNAGPVDYDQLRTALGVVDAAVSIRVKNTSSTFAAATLARRYAFCDADGSESTQAACETLMAEADADPRHFSSVETLRAVRAALRSETVAAALALVTEHVSTYCDGTDACTSSALSTVPNAPYDGSYADYGEPSWIIEGHLAASGEI